MSDNDGKNHAVQLLIDYLEQHFRCEHGERRAFFEMPAPGGNVTRVIYVSYVVNGPDWGSVEDWMIDNVLKPLVEKAGENTWLYWRLEECFEVRTEDDRIQLRTRIGVLDKDLNAVEITECMKPEGDSVIRIDGSQI